jgi:twitching motility protein PilT
VNQREVGSDTKTFALALRAALRQAPKVILIGEMRDVETIEIALEASETGHLVLSTLHTTDVASTIARISDSFPPERQPTIRQELAMAISAVLTQILLPSKRGGRVPVAELLMIGYGARQHIRRNALQHLHQEITMTKNKGSVSQEESLQQLVRQGDVDREEALLYAAHPDDLLSLIRAEGRNLAS